MCARNDGQSFRQAQDTTEDEGAADRQVTRELYYILQSGEPIVLL